MTRIIAAISFTAAATLSWGQNCVPIDSSNNAKLSGTYFFRHLSVVNYDTNGNVTEMAASYGKIVFDGKGNYTLTGQKVDNGVSGGVPQPLSVTATYGLGANYLGSIDNPLAPTDCSSWIYLGMGGSGVLVGSSTEGAYNDTFIAIPAPSSNATNSSLSGTYSMGLIDFPGAVETDLKNAQFQLVADGKGDFGALSYVGQIATSTSAVTQSASGATYAVQSDGSFALTVPTPSGVTANNSLFSGSKVMFLSADGNFVVGGTSNGFDIFFGVKAPSAAFANSNYAGIYYMSALEDQVASGYGVDSFYGSVKATGAGVQILHERLDVPSNNFSFDYGTDDHASPDPTVADCGSASLTACIIDDFGYSYAFGANGASFVAVGTGGTFSMIAGIQAPSITGSGVFLHPLYITNAFSLSPPTDSWAPGELISLYGTGLAPSSQATTGGIPFPTQINGVQVLVNGTAAPVYRLIKGTNGGLDEVDAIVPYADDPSLTPAVGYAQIQVVNNGSKSNVVTWWLNDNAPGIAATGGVGNVAALRTSSSGSVSVITPTNPTHRGETISLFLTGLGAVSPTVTDGAIGPTSPLSQSVAYTGNYLSVFFNDYTSGNIGEQATISFAGLAPGLAGLYQMNVVVPNTVGTGGSGTPDQVYIEIVTDSADVNQVQVPVQ